MLLQPIKFIKEIDPADSNYQYVYVDLVHRCNMECNNCYLPNRDYPDVNYDKLIEFIDKFTKKTEFRLIGGEPTLYDKLSEVINHISNHQLGHRVTLVTNGLKLASKRYTNLLKQAGLNRVYLSMNGFDCDDVYKQIDDMPCAKLKMSALENVIKSKIAIGIGFIIVKGINEHIIDRMINYFKSKNLRMSFEFRNIGEIGRNMILSNNRENYNFNDIIDLLETKFNFDRERVYIDDDYSRVYKVDKFIVRINDWCIFQNPTESMGNSLRGRMTENYKLSQFFEHLKINEWQY